MMRGNTLASKRGQILQQIYDTVGANTFRAMDVPSSSHVLTGMWQDGMLDKVAKSYTQPGHSGKAVNIWRISRDGLCIIRGERIDREQSRRELYHGKKINGKNTR